MLVCCMSILRNFCPLQVYHSYSVMQEKWLVPLSLKGDAAHSHCGVAM